MRVVAYTYYNSPWDMKSGDDVRIHMILAELAKSYRVVAVNLSAFARSYHVHRQNGVVYVTVPRRFYRFVSTLVGWSRHFDLNPLMKLTHYIDEFITALRFINWFRDAKAVIIFGSMSLFPFMLRILGAKNATIIYDPLANYAQTLYLRSRKSFVELLRYGLYLALHKLQLKSSNIVVYPSRVDLENAKRMFRVEKTIIVPNPIPICYNSVEEYLELRKKRDDFSRPYFILLAGGRGKANEETVRITIEVFNKLSPEKFKLIITGPWQDMKKYVENPSIELTGVVTKEKLKELLTIADYGLAPIFSHAAGTFVKVLSYISAGLDIIASPSSIVGLNPEHLKSVNVYLVRNKQEYAKIVAEIVYGNRVIETSKTRNVMLCRDTILDMVNTLKAILNRDSLSY
jgi:glycosyltransferase involved in cell wall biosynthesis